ncbi:uncharacterized protein DUF3450 [Tamilnaduibacter salinus]|uniref:Uncharacterized protein DUF3450 n=1 Tax=Tamilnaduibacter salinus TaxID=1484056 RepID=A0A2U1CY72_9GAMM|nr:DUF3450 domain-containing protein [Tamilnaduibacter salinus]PVY77367.1 uncharacterized protein DUF3450 [Tamilnaduibacter salinus]
MPSPSSRYRRYGLSLAICGALLCAPVTASAQDPGVDDVVNAGVDRLEKNQAFQQRINELDEAIRDKVERYREVNKEIEGLEVYLDQLQSQVSSQDAEKTDLNESIDRVTQIERQITPLMLKMIKGLERFVSLDKPFLQKEREKRIARLQDMMGRSDVSVAEKFRNVLEAYQTEVDYGRTIEAYRGSLASGDQPREVDFLRIGRIALLYQTLDDTETGVWNPNSEQWETLPATYNSQISEGLRIAREQAAPSLISLPLNTPEETQ